MCFVNWPNGNSFLFLNVICEIADLSKFLVILRNHLQTYDQGVIKGLLRRWASDQFSPHAWIGSHRRMRSVSWANRPVGAHPSPNQTSAVQLDRLTWSRRAWLLISSGLVGGVGTLRPFRWLYSLRSPTRSGDKIGPPTRPFLLRSCSKHIAGLKARTVDGRINRYLAQLGRLGLRMQSVS